MKTEIESFHTNNLQQTLEDGFMKFDEHLKGEKVLAELKELAGMNEDEAEEEMENGGMHFKPTLLFSLRKFFKIFFVNRLATVTSITVIKNNKICTEH